MVWEGRNELILLLFKLKDCRFLREERIRYIIIIIIIVVVIVNIIMNVIETFKKLSMVACNSFVGAGGGGFSAFLVLWGLTLSGAGGNGKGIWGGRGGALRGSLMRRVRVDSEAMPGVPCMVVTLELREVGWGRRPRLVARSSSTTVRSAPGS